MKRAEHLYIALRLILLFILSLCFSQAWASVAVSGIGLLYGYDENAEYSYDDFGVETSGINNKNHTYDDGSNISLCCSGQSARLNSQQAREGYFFAFLDGLVAAKGAGKPDFIVSPKGTTMPTNKDFNLVDSNKKGGDWFQIHNKHTDAKVNGSPHTHYPKQHGGSRTREIKRTDGGDLDRADGALRSGTMRERRNRGDKGG